MQKPLEGRFGPFVAILISSAFFMLVHLTKTWAMIGMVPIVLGAGVLLGLLAFASDTLVFCMIGHTIMDIGLFAYWWTQIAGTFSQQPISVSGIDHAFYIACAVFTVALIATLLAIARLWGAKRRPGTAGAIV
jgi:membrane protease YdiL (CAAX protease family)